MPSLSAYEDTIWGIIFLDSDSPQYLISSSFPSFSILAHISTHMTETLW